MEFNTHLLVEGKIKSIETDLLSKNKEIPLMFKSNEKLNIKIQETLKQSQTLRLKTEESSKRIAAKERKTSWSNFKKQPLVGGHSKTKKKQCTLA